MEQAGLFEVIAKTEWQRQQEEKEREEYEEFYWNEIKPGEKRLIEDPEQSELETQAQTKIEESKEESSE